MKTSRLSLCFILFSIFTNSLLSVAAEQPVRGPNSLLSAGAEEPAPVLDIDGDELLAGRDYYIVSSIIGAGGGGVTLASVGNEVCPLSVVQLRSDLQNGQPLYFRPVNPREGVVRLSTDQNIIFHALLDASTECLTSTVWKVYYEEYIRRYVIKTGGEVGNPGPETISNWFKIEATGGIGSYKLRFCPTVSDFKVICRDVRIFSQDGKRRLALIDDDDDARAFTVVFVKAP